MRYIPYVLCPLGGAFLGQAVLNRDYGLLALGVLLVILGGYLLGWYSHKDAK